MNFAAPFFPLALLTVVFGAPDIDELPGEVVEDLGSALVRANWKTTSEERFLGGMGGCFGDMGPGRLTPCLGGTGRSGPMSSEDVSDQSESSGEGRVSSSCLCASPSRTLPPVSQLVPVVCVLSGSAQFQNEARFKHPAVYI